MAVQISGTQVSWGIPSALKTDSDSIIEGIVQDIKISVGGNTNEIQDEDGDYVSRVDHGAKNTVTIQTLLVITDPVQVLPAKGDAVTFTATADGVDLTAGKAFIESAEITYKGVDTTGVSLTVVHYPLM